MGKTTVCVLAMTVITTVNATGVFADPQSNGAANAISDSSDSRQRAALRDVCGTCHGVDVVTGLRLKSEWDGVVDAMKSLGADGTREEFALVDLFIVRNLTFINVNTDPAAQLAPAFDVAPSAGAAIVKYRTERGPFKSIDDLTKVTGLPAEKITARKARLRF